MESWVDNETGSWKKDVIRHELAGNAQYVYQYGNKLMITLDDCPRFISDRLPLTEAQEDQMAAFFAQLPGIIRETISFHLYAHGPDEYTAEDLFIGKCNYREQAGAVAAVVKYQKEKNFLG